MYDGNAHSGRLEDDRWWHSFVNLPFVIAVDGAENLHYPAPSATLLIRAPAAPATTAGAFSVPQP